MKRKKSYLLEKNYKKIPNETLYVNNINEDLKLKGKKTRIY